MVLIRWAGQAGAGVTLLVRRVVRRPYAIIGNALRRSEDERARNTRSIRHGEDSPVWDRRFPGWRGDTPGPTGPVRMPLLSSGGDRSQAGSRSLACSDSLRKLKCGNIPRFGGSRWSVVRHRTRVAMSPRLAAGRLVRQHDPEEDGPLAGPILADGVADIFHRGGELFEHLREVSPSGEI